MVQVSQQASYTITPIQSVARDESLTLVITWYGPGPADEGCTHPPTRTVMRRQAPDLQL